MGKMQSCRLIYLHSNEETYVHLTSSYLFLPLQCVADSTTYFMRLITDDAF